MARRLQLKAFLRSMNEAEKPPEGDLGRNTSAMAATRPAAYRSGAAKRTLRQPRGRVARLGAAQEAVPASPYAQPTYRHDRTVTVPARDCRPFAGLVTGVIFVSRWNVQNAHNSIPYA